MRSIMPFLKFTAGALAVGSLVMAAGPAQAATTAVTITANGFVPKDVTVLVGFSLGGYVAMALGATRPGIARSLLIADASREPGAFV